MTAVPTTVLTGGCLCGATRYAAAGAPRNVRVCHCRLCQAAVGAAFNARAVFPRAAVEIAGPVGRYPSSPEVVRGFCRACGTALFSERAGADAIGLTLGSMDDPDACPRPTEHVWTSRRQAWLRLDDGLPQHPEGAPP